MELRPYQRDCIASIQKGWPEFTKQLAVCPTGSGKTIIAANLARQEIDSGGRVLFLAHREELLLQTLDKFSKAAGIIAQLEKAEYRASHLCPAVVGSVQTFLARGERWADEHFSLIIVDEAHHCMADSYQKILTRMKAKVLGITATPDRADKRNLGTYFENVAYEISLFDLINQKFLCPIAIRAVPLQIDLSAVKQSAGDYDARDLEDALLPYMDSIAKAMHQHAGNRKSLVFLPLISTSKAFRDILEKHGFAARHVDGTSGDRRETIAAFARGEFQVLCNAMLLTEGYDDPTINCIVNLRPTRSRPLYSQIVGRGTRIAEGKTDLLLMDFLFMHEKHQLVRPAHLIAGNDEEAQQIIEESFKEERYAEGDLDLQGLASICRHEREEALAEKLRQLATRKEKFVSPEEFAVRHHQIAIAEFEPTMGWHTREMSPKQREWVEKAGVNPDLVKGRGQASLILDVHFKELGRQPASSAQRYRMRQSGWMSKDGKRNADMATRDDAKEYFAALNAR